MPLLPRYLKLLPLRWGLPAAEEAVAAAPAPAAAPPHVAVAADLRQVLSPAASLPASFLLHLLLHFYRRNVHMLLLSASCCQLRHFWRSWPAYRRRRDLPTPRRRDLLRSLFPGRSARSTDRRSLLLSLVSLVASAHLAIGRNGVVEAVQNTLVSLVLEMTFRFLRIVRRFYRSRKVLAEKCHMDAAVFVSFCHPNLLDAH